MQRASKSREMASLALDADAIANLVADARGGCRVAADRLVREHDHWVRSVIFGVTGRADRVDDIAQQVWAQAWERLESLRDPRYLRSWLYRIARNTAIDLGKARRRRAQQELQTEATADEFADAETPTPLRLTIGDETQQTIMQAIQGLPLLYREPFVLRHMQDWSYAEIGALLELPVETVETRLVRARRLLRESLRGKL